MRRHSRYVLQYPNPGGEYKLWLIAQSSAVRSCTTTVNPDNISLAFDHKCAKTDNFKLILPAVAHVIACKYNDTNGNGVLDPGELNISGWPITATVPSSSCVTLRKRDNHHWKNRFHRLPLLRGHGHRKGYASGGQPDRSEQDRVDADSTRQRDLVTIPAIRLQSGGSRPYRVQCHQRRPVLASPVASYP
jgi:hypothetical protein